MEDYPNGSILETYYITLIRDTFDTHLIVSVGDGRVRHFTDSFPNSVGEVNVLSDESISDDECGCTRVYVVTGCILRCRGKLTVRESYTHSLSLRLYNVGSLVVSFTSL